MREPAGGRGAAGARIAASAAAVVATIALGPGRAGAGTALATPVVARPSSPAWAKDAPDPDLVRVGDRYYAYTTGTTWGNHIGVLESSSATSGWHLATSGSGGSSALPDPPSWEATNTQNAPTVAEIGGRFVMFYDAAEAADPSLYCLSRAVATSPAGPFVDRSAAPFGPCSAAWNGTIDPDLYRSGSRWYLAWKENDSGPYRSAQLIADGLASGGSHLSGPVQVLATQDSATYPWEATIENPEMLEAGGRWWLLFSAGLWTNSTYSEAVATCSGPVGPCRGVPTRLLTSYGSVHGPGGGSAVEGPHGQWYLAVAAWTSPCTGEAAGCGRELYVAPVAFAPLQIATTSLPRLVAGQPVHLFLAASGGIGPEQWSATGLPTGLALRRSSGLLAGVPARSGRYDVRVEVRTSGVFPERAERTLTVAVGS